MPWSTHAHNNSVTEALACGVPMLALPFSTDQFDGAAAIEAANFGGFTAECHREVRYTPARDDCIFG